MNKKMIIILSVLVLFLIIGGVSASETNTTDEKVSTANIDGTVSSTNEVNMTDELSVVDAVEENINNNENMLNDDSSNFTNCIASINYEDRDNHWSTLNTNCGRGDAFVYNSGAPDSNVINCLFKSNVAKSGGTIEVASGNTTCYIENCDLSDSEDILLNSNDDKLSVSSVDVYTFSELSDAIRNNVYSEINIRSNLIVTSQININRDSFTINGNGYIIDANFNSRTFFILSHNNITFNNITFINNMFRQTNIPEAGSCMWFINCHDIFLKNCNFKNGLLIENANTMGGGFLAFGNWQNTNYPTGTSSTCYNLFIEKCFFINGTATPIGSSGTQPSGYSAHGGAISFIYSSCDYNINIIDCAFINNTAYGCGGHIIFHGDGHYNVKVKNTLFEKGKCGLNGGAIEARIKNSGFDNCTFLNNNASATMEGATAGSFGGAITLYSSCDYVNFTNCNFINNSVYSYNGERGLGGAFASRDITCRYTYIDNCTFIGNHAYNGGAIYYKSSYTTMNNSYFSNNSATNVGGAVYSDASGSIVDSSTFKNCTASRSNYFYQAQPITFINTYFPEVYVGEDNAGGDSLDPSSLGKFSTAMALVETGGTMYIVGSLTNFQNHEVTRGITIKPYTSSSNINLASVSGRAFTISASDVTIRDLTFSGSKYNGNGGVLYWNGDNAYIYNCTFQNNVLSSYTSSGKGGVIYVTGNSDIFTVEKCTFKDNKAYDGGAIYVDDVTDNTLIYNSVFTGDYATHYGGALYYEGSICYYVDENTNRDFSGNFAGGNSAYANIYDGEATKCILDVYVSLNGDGDGSTFNTPTNFNNGFKLVAPNGKINFVTENEIFNLGEDYRISKFNVTFLGNHSTLNDASFTITPTSHSIKFYNIIFTGNTEHTIIWNGIDGIVENCTFKDNGGNNGLKGAAIQVYGDNLQVKNSIFSNNRALSSGANGGAIWCNATNLKIINSNFTNNKANTGGIHVYLAESASYTLITRSRFINGTKTGTGSAIILTNGTIIVSNSVFEKNSGDYGGALRLLNGSATINGSAFTSNEATYGGAIYSNMPLTLTYSNFTRNQADYGGALYLFGTRNSLTDLIFERNVAKIGSAIYFNTSDDITLKKIKFTTNTATEDATVYFTSNCNVYNDENVVFTGNTLPSDSSLNVVVPNAVEINANVYYVSNNGGGTGLTWGNDATTLDYALSHIFEGGKIIFSQDTYEFENAIAISKNIALVGNQTTLKRKNSMVDKYLFIPLSQFI